MSNVVIAFMVIVLVDFLYVLYDEREFVDFFPMAISICGGRKRELQRDKCQIR